jgi:4-diphosphocytidyl-2-C-methyl-D-erythritol kinase
VSRSADDPAALRGARAVQVAAQAKVNLRLRILARETTGYHQLETIFLRLELADIVRVRRARKRSLDVSGSTDAAALGPVEQNLAWRAADAYAEAASLRGDFAIELEKHIPVGGGLGGGSADAGAVLRALDAMAAKPMGEAALLEIAATLGADVPFLTSERACALVWGRGERMLALEPPAARGVALLVPAFAVRTADAFGWLAARPLAAPAAAAAMLDVASLTSWDALAAIAENDFTTVVTAHHPVLAAMTEALSAAGCAPAMLTGSGSTIFGVLPAGAPLELPPLNEPCTALLTHSAIRVEPVSALD